MFPHLQNFHLPQEDIRSQHHWTILLFLLTPPGPYFSSHKPPPTRISQQPPEVALADRGCRAAGAMESRGQPFWVMGIHRTGTYVPYILIVPETNVYSTWSHGYHGCLEDVVFSFWGPGLFFQGWTVSFGKGTIKIDHSCTYMISYKNLLCKMDPMVVGDEDLFLRG